MTPQWVYAHTRKGRIPHVKLGRHYYRYNAAAIDAWLEGIEVSTHQPVGSVAHARRASRQ
jgi:excisionase family DNA binding protein